MFAGIYHPVGIAMLTEVEERRGRVLAINGVCGNMGLAAAALTTGLIAENFGWRMAFVLPGLLALVAGALHILLDTENQTAKQKAAATGRAVTPHRHATMDVKRLLIFVVIAALLSGAIFNGVSLTMPKLLHERLAEGSGDLVEIGAWASLIFAVSGVAQLPVGCYLDHHPVRPLIIALFAGQAVALGVVAVTFGFAIVPVTMVLVLLMFSWLPVTGWLIGSYFAVEWRSRVLSVEYTLSLGTTALVVPAIALLHENGLDFQGQYLILMTFAAALFAAIWLLPAQNHVSTGLAAAE